MNLITGLICLCLVAGVLGKADQHNRLRKVLMNCTNSLRDVLERIKSGKRKTDSYADLKSKAGAEDWLDKTNEQLRKLSTKSAETNWNLQTNVTSENQKKVAEVEVEMAKFLNKILEKAKDIDPNVLDDNYKRQLRLLTLYGSSHNPEVIKETSLTSSEMMEIFDSAKVCREGKPKNCLSKEPDLYKIMSESRDPSELLWAWKGWRDVTGSKIRPLYEKYIKLLNQGAVENNFSDYGAFWRDMLFDQTPDIEAKCDRLWEEIKPIYVQLHAFVRKKLTEKYGKKIVGTSGAIPAHILGNMHAQEWNNIFEIIIPKTSKNRMKSIKDRENKELQRKYDVNGLFRLAEEFFCSISLYNMTDIFWGKSMLVKPKDREVQCHASAHDMYRKNDFRIKMCTEINFDYLTTVHHEMGHVEYFMAYANQPTLFRGSPNSAFHEAVGDTIDLSVMSLKHLEILGLIDANTTNNNDVVILTLLEQALSKIAFLPFGYLLDKWRWKVFSGEIESNEYNKRFWEMSLKYQGLVAPVLRSEKDFDPGAKFHVPSNSPYMIYFFSHLAQFQFYEALCKVSGHTGPLHLCDFYKSKEAGAKFKKMLQLGSSVPWQQALFQLTGSRDISTTAIKKYFEPLTKWLSEQLKGETLGWDKAKINWEE